LRRNKVPPQSKNKKEKPMKKLLINIWAYDHHAKFTVLAEDNAKSVENAILDKLGEKSIICLTGRTFPLNRITYEEVIL
jgi:hypothetical protein